MYYRRRHGERQIPNEVRPNGVNMANVYVEQQSDGSYVATQNKREIAWGDTQREAIDGARAARPDDPVLAERVRDTDRGGRDKWRRAW